MLIFTLTVINLGNPELRLALNEDLVIGKGGAYGSVTLDDCNFHECVQLQDFETSRTLSFIPPDGEFVVLNYRVTGEFRAPFRVFPAIDEVSPYKLDVTIRCRADIPETNYGANVVIRIPVPRNTASAECELAQVSDKIAASLHRHGRHQPTHPPTNSPNPPNPRYLTTLPLPERRGSAGGVLQHCEACDLDHQKVSG